MTSSSPTPPAVVLRDMIAEKLHSTWCAAGKGDECAGPTRAQREAADTVMELFPDVEAIEWCTWHEMTECFGATEECLNPATRYVLRTRPAAPAERVQDAPTDTAGTPEHPDVTQPLGDHPHTDPGDGRTECQTCGKWVFEAIHSCKQVPVTPPARARRAREAP